MNSDANYRTLGQLIKALLESRGWTQRILAIVLKVEETGINKIVSGKKPLDAEMALMLSDVFDIEPERFLELQKSYDLAKARIVLIPDPNRASRARLFGELPVGEMIKRGWLDADNVRDVPKVEAALTKFFDATSADEIEIHPHAAKKTNVSTAVTPAQLAWLY